MSGIIQILPESLINQIAAGEVVERPASVVKELLENSVDAGASDIQVDILQSGRSSIRVTDNGRGMTKEDLVLAVERHATSKIREYADLIALKSMGFRGEALPSIAAVSRLTILSTPREGLSGHRLEIWGGKKISLEEVGGTAGTTVEVLDLFYNTPARMAFLKSPRVEWNQIQMAFERVALGFPQLRFELIHNGKKIFQLFPAPELLLRLQDLWGSEKINALIPVDLTEDRIRIYGFISPPHCHQNTSRNIAFIVNQRWVRSPLLYPLILRSYAGMIPSGRFPTAVLWMEVPPELIDVNIHPFKQEVRFSQTTWIQTLVGKAIGQSLKSYVPKPEERERRFFPTPWSPAPAQPFLFKESDLPPFLTPLTQKTDSIPWAAENFDISADQKTSMIDRIPDEESPAGREGGFAQLSVLGQVQGTYLVSLTPQGLVLIDQHAAHERVLYERYLSQWQAGGVSSQYLIVPILVELPSGWSIDLETIIPEMAAFGFEIAMAGGNSVWIKSIPAGMSSGQGETALKEILEEMKMGTPPIRPEDFNQSLLKLLACHSAIRAGQALGPEEIKTLLNQLDQVESPSHCPHGRPLWILFSWEEVEG
ncbi:MAG: DNA mismatch repair endonuclease MutL [Deltaproteobacteria bacterium]|nr:DNA mismatch repair endonuclease MutL [Deltaproteobacteria bacterium]